MIPTLDTGRLRLRPPALADAAPFAAIFAEERARYIGGPLDARGAYRLFAVGVAQWALTGFGSWTIADRATGAYLGDVGLLHPPHYPEVELGWTLAPEAEGRGIAFEAAGAALDWAFRTLGLATLVSYIDPGNVRSIRLAERLGARLDSGAVPSYPGDLVYRHGAPA